MSLFPAHASIDIAQADLEGVLDPVSPHLQQRYTDSKGWSLPYLQWNQGQDVGQAVKANFELDQAVNVKLLGQD